MLGKGVILASRASIITRCGGLAECYTGQRIMPDQDNLNATEVPQESANESWTYPKAFDAALRELYERSFAECALAPGVQAEALQELNAWAGRPAPYRFDFLLSIHTAEMWAAGRLDLTAESLMLSDKWRTRFQASWIRDAENLLSALGYASDQQKLLDSGSAASAFPDWRLEQAGYLIRILDKRAFLIFERVRHLAVGTWLLDRRMDEWENDGCDPKRPYAGQLCPIVLECEQRLLRAPFLKYDEWNHRHHLFCESCRSAAPVTFALCDAVACEQFRRMRLFLANLVECLDFSDLKIKKLLVALNLPEQGQYGLPSPDQYALRNAVLWRIFLLINYLPHVADMFVYCSKPRIPGEMVNPWTALRSGAGYPEAVRFVQSLPRREFEAAVFAQEILSAIPDYPDFLAFREKSCYPIKAPQIPSSQEVLQPIPGFLDVREPANDGDWQTFVDHTVAEEMPWWGFDMLEGLFKLAVKAAKTALVESGLEGADGSADKRLETIENQTHAIYGAQLPMLDLVMGTKQAVDHVANQQKEQSGILEQIRNQLSRPTKRHAEVSLRRVLGEAVFSALTDEARIAALEGELRYLQGDSVDPSVISFQFAKAFECQLRKTIMEPYQKGVRGFQTDYKYLLSDVGKMLEQSPADFLRFLEQNGFDYRLLQRKIDKLIDVRNLAAHQAAISEQRASDLRRDWLGIGRSNDSIFAALIPKSAAGTRKNEPRAGTS